MFKGFYARVEKRSFRNARQNFILRFIEVRGKFHSVNGFVVNFDFKPFGKRVCDRRAYAVQTARIRIVIVIELAARVKLGKNNFYAADARFGVNVDGHAAPVVFNGRASVGV